MTHGPFVLTPVTWLWLEELGFGFSLKPKNVSRA